MPRRERGGKKGSGGGTRGNESGDDVVTSPAYLIKSLPTKATIRDATCNGIAT